MKNNIFEKGLVCGIIFLFLSISIIPIASSLSTEKLNFDSQVINTTLNGPYNPTWVRSCFGFVIDVWPIISENKTVGYWFYAGDVICTTKTSGKPIFHHFHNREELAISEPVRGIFKCVMIYPDFKELWFICVRSS
jgi:hypothetical protein